MTSFPESGSLRHALSTGRRDLHDILGHSLTVISVKAELAGRLAESGSARAVSEIGDIERLALEALADVRATIQGHRQVTLSSELVNARAALSAAGIDAQLPNALDEAAATSASCSGGPCARE
ncbi:MAG: histidine kinase dimerization/phosphoacceptor domain-containing protein [Nocardioidaceae bacterium]